ncbi:hypothetical protein GSUB_10390 [Geoalkalibacter subterraneus]|uniref:Uncharacterized protein n=1 Tax=Geoalkalibacter subterraneus TaxID=483547 RepID=A0A0B5FTD0_9BACT|nr:hypothetical protein GSUB_10390 [Geoalkalibacter subterraneus]
MTEIAAALVQAQRLVLQAQIKNVDQRKLTIGLHQDIAPMQRAKKDSPLVQQRDKGTEALHKIWQICPWTLAVPPQCLSG